MKRKISKKGALMKRRNRIAMAELRNAAIVYHTDLENKQVFLVDTRTLKPIQFNAYHRHAVENLNQKWAMAMVTIGIEPNGRQNMKIEEQKLGEHYHHANLIEYFNDEHATMLNSINPKFGKKACWIATLEIQDWNEEQIYSLMKIGA